MIGQGARGLTRGVDDLGRTAEILVRHDQPSPRLIIAGHRALVGHSADRAAASVDLEQLLLAVLGSNGVEGPPVRSPAQGPGSAIPVGRQRPRAGAVGVADHHNSLVAVDILAPTRQPGQTPTVGREGRAGVGGRIAVGQIDRWPAVHRGAVKVQIVGESLGPSLHLGRENDAASVRRDDEFTVVAQGSGGRVAVHAGHQVARLTRRQARGVQRHGEQVVAAAVVPVVPRPQRQAVIGPHGRNGGSLGLDAVAGAGEIGAIDEHRQGDDQRPAVGRQPEGGDIDWQGGHLYRGLALAVHAPDLAGTAAR